MRPTSDLFVGIDVGTGGVRVVVADATGTTHADADVAFPGGADVTRPDGAHEQDPENWWRTLCACGRQAVGQLAQAGCSAQSIAAVAVTSTSGTIVPVDHAGCPCRPAMMYNDGRATAQAERCADVGRELTDRLGYRFNASFALPKLLWLAEREPATLRRARWICHAADFIVGRLTGRYDVSDTSNTLKTGYDLIGRQWPDWIGRDLGLPRDKLPSVTGVGDPIGEVAPDAAAALGLPAGVRVMAGASDGTAAMFSSGASRAGQWSVTIGTTLVLKGISDRIVSDPAAGLYCHLHPEGWWLPGGASNVGGRIIAEHFPDDELPDLNRRVFDAVPNDLVGYPLVGQGERFPFVDATVTGFWTHEPHSRLEHYAAVLEAVSFVERWALERVGEMGCHVTDEVFTSGGATRSEAWLRVRAACQGRRVHVAATPQAAFGAAVIAAAGATDRPLSEVSADMVHVDRTIEPDADLREYLDGKYAVFRNACAQRGYGQE